MTKFYQFRFLHIFAAVGLTVLGGCQGGIGRSMPDFNMPNIFARSKERKVPEQHPIIPTPEVTGQNYAQVQLAMGDSMAKEGNFEAAQAAYEAALRNDDTLARAYHRLALLQEKTGKGNNTKELFQQAIKLDPRNAEIACDYGYWCYLRQDWNEALKQFDRALKLDPNLKRAHNNLGLVYARTGRPDHALQQFEFAGLSPGDARANLGFVYLTQKRFPEAKTELQLAATGTASSKKARDVLAHFEKIEANAQQPMQPVASSAPAAEPTIHEKFEIAPVAAAETPSVAETPRVATAETPRAIAHPAETPRPAVAETPRPPVVETPRIAQAEPPRYATVASAPATELPNEPRPSDRNLPTQQLAPVLSDYQF
jgi:Tfp pilus assembly protein PilF